MTTTTTTNAPFAPALTHVLSLHPARCCGTSVGGRIRRWNPAAQAWEYLLQGRAWHPKGWSPVAGHAEDKDADIPWERMLAEEVNEELGLTLVSCTFLVGPLHLPNLCASPPALAGGAARDLSEHALEAVWVQLLALTGDITATPLALAAAARLYTTPPDRYWLGEAFEEELPAYLARTPDPAPALIDALALPEVDQRLLVGSLTHLADAGHPRPALARVRVDDMTATDRALCAITSSVDLLPGPAQEATAAEHAAHEALLAQALTREAFHGPDGRPIDPGQEFTVPRPAETGHPA